MRKWFLAATVVALAMPVVPAMADPPDWAPAHGWRHHHHQEGDENDNGYAPSPPHTSVHITIGDGDEDRPPPPPRRHRAVRVITSGDTIYRGDDGRYYCHRSDGTGLVSDRSWDNAVTARLSVNF